MRHRSREEKEWKHGEARACFDIKRVLSLCRVQILVERESPSTGNMKVLRSNCHLRCLLRREGAPDARARGLGKRKSYYHQIRDLS